MKKNVLVKTLIILAIIVISLISFVGVYQKRNNKMVNVVPDAILSKNLYGYRVIQMVVDDSTKEVIYDAEGNVTTEGLDDEGNLLEGYTKADEKVNKDEILTKENFELVKRVLDKRLENLGVTDFAVRQNLDVGTVTVEIPEDSYADRVVSNLLYKGKFEIIDSETKEVLLDNSHVKEAKAVYSTLETGTAVYLSIEFNKDGKEKLEEITKVYVPSTDEEGNTTYKKVTINLDEEEIIETYFENEITNGVLQLSVGSVSTSNEQITSYIQEASEVAALITDEAIPIAYEIENNTYLSSTISNEQLQLIIILIGCIVLIGFIYLVIKYKVKGVLADISFVGFVALVWIILRYTNVVISLESILAMIVILFINYIWINYILNKLNKNDMDIKEIIKQSYIHYIFILLPILVISIVFTFTAWTPIASIGMVMVWGLIIMFIYQYVITKTLLDN